MKYKHLFFDLDHTIWDFDKNAEETLKELFECYRLNELGVSSDAEFISRYTENNHRLWADYHTGKITKAELRKARFQQTFESFGLTAADIPLEFENDYVRICPTKTNLFPNAHETLSYLYSKYRLHLITNGFAETTERKLEHSGLNKYFDNINISELIGFNKPHKGIFEHALSLAKATAAESVMIGDSLEADMQGANAVGMTCIFFNPRNQHCFLEVNHEIKSLEELIKIL